MSRTALLAWTLSLAALVAWAAFAHRFTVADDRSAAAYGLAVLTGWALALAIGWSRPRRARWVGAASVVAVLAWASRRYVSWDPSWIYLVQHAGVHGLLALVFGATLRSGSTPLVTRLALAVQGPLPGPLLHYTRQVTWLWSGYFVAMTTLSLVLFATGPTLWWSVLANFVTPPAIAALFVGEYAYRRWRFPHFEHAGVLDGVRAFSARSAAPARREP